MSAAQVSWKLCGKRRNCSWQAISPFHASISTLSENFPPLSSNLKNYRLQFLEVWKMTKYLIWEWVKWQTLSNENYSNCHSYLTSIWACIKCYQVVKGYLYSFPKTSFWDRPKFKEAADHIWNVAIKGFLETDCIENIVGKGEIAHFEQFHLFPRCFPKTFFFNVLEWVYVRDSNGYRFPYLVTWQTFRPSNQLLGWPTGLKGTQYHWWPNWNEMGLMTAKMKWNPFLFHGDLK